MPRVLPRLHLCHCEETPMPNARGSLMPKLQIITLQNRQGIPVQFSAPVLTPVAALRTGNADDEGFGMPLPQ